jgi:hypothetical protein
LILGASLVLCAAGCGSNRASDAAKPLTVVPRMVPKLPVAHYRTSGRYFRVERQGVALAPVNRTLADALAREERTWAARARAELATLPASLVKLYTGTFRVQLDPRLVSASTSVVSALVPTLELFPGGNDGNGWISVTARVPSGAPVTLPDLIEPGGWNSLSFAAHHALMRTNSCFRERLTIPAQAQHSAEGLAPRPSNFRHFALTASGLALGFGIGDVAGVPCGGVFAIVPYADIEAHRTPAGRDLVASLRLPVR